MNDERRNFRFIMVLFAFLLGAYFFTTQKEFISNRLTINESFPSETVDRVRDSFDQLQDLPARVQNQLLSNEIDFDNDGLSNQLEALLVSDLSKSDSDGDGKTDFEEFIAKTDPADFSNSNPVNASFIEKRLRSLDDAGIENTKTYAKNYYLERAIYHLGEGNKIEAKENIVFAFQYVSEAQIFTDLLREFEGSEDLENSLVIANTYIDMLPEDPDAYFHRGFVYQQQQQNELSEQDYLVASEMGSENPFLYNNLGILAQESGDDDLAFTYYSQALALDPDNEVFYRNQQSISQEVETNQIAN